ncbi:ImmA/IrrE family metallo-endopeptidase [Frankia sp. CiP3]|uniref:ImmA/IrrE family metallo-endopeptidase n=1 Tax=Frankia sp. CiP3 TaxID=2880971 RepID=UPI001EF744A6|nr:ImmA/IrrE family metallo-endopeptidase [Frankia sp. CiP3]
MSVGIELQIEWFDAPGVRAPELAATWARYQLWVGGSCVTQVEEPDGTFRRSIYGSLYPLAEWIAANWWLLTGHLRPSATRPAYWTWSNLRRYPWLRQHNLRGAGDGMAWPDLTVVPEGAVTRVVWAADEDRALGPLRFASSGRALVRSDEARKAMAGVVQRVLDRLAESDVGKTPLSVEWAEIGSADEDEQEFCLAAARLGLDPYSVGEATSTKLLAIVPAIPAELQADFLDAADLDALEIAAQWIPMASEAAGRASADAAMSLTPLRAAVAGELAADAVPNSAGLRRPWHIGFDMARAVRQALNAEATAPFDISAWVGAQALQGPAGGLQGFAAVRNDRCGLALSDPPKFASAAVSGSHYQSFRRAKALGWALFRPHRQIFLLSSAHTGDDRVAGAFAAELLAPAEGIRRALATLETYDEDAALDVIASHFGVSPLTIRHQVDNQLVVLR